MGKELVKIRMDRLDNKRWKLNVYQEPELCYQNTHEQLLLNSAEDPENEVDRILERIDFNKHFNLYIFGFRNIRLIEEIVRRKSPFSALTIIELGNEDSLEVVAGENFVKILGDRTVELIVGNKTEILESVQKNIRNVFRTYNLRNTNFITCPYVKSLYQRDIQDIINYIFENMFYLAAAYGNSVEDVLWGVDNLVNNWSFSTKGHPVDPFKNKYKGRPAVIVGAGPSLDKNIHLLNAARDKALVFCVDAAVDDLMKHGIHPDAVSTIERTEQPIEMYSQVEHFGDTVFLGPNVIKGEILEKFDKWIFTGRYGDAVFRKLTDELGQTNLEVGNNVAHVPFAFARYMGCDPIILVGLDLAFSDGKTHSSEVNKYLTEDILGIYLSKTTKVRGQNNDVLDTYEEFMYARVWFETEMALNKTFRYINATEGGSYISGCEHMKLQSVIDMLNDAPVMETRLCDLYRQIPFEAGYGRKITDIAINFMTKLREDTVTLQEAAREAISYIEDNEKYGRVQRVEENRMKLEEQLLSNIAMRFIFQAVAMSYNRDLHSFPIMLNTEDEEGLIKRSVHYYSTLDKVGDKLSESVEIYLKILNTIMEGLE